MAAQIDSQLAEKFLQILPREAKLLLAVSGGLDSCVLLDLVARFQGLHQCVVTILHLDHGLRSDSTLDAQFVQSLGQKYLYPVIVKKCINPPQTNIEAWGRTERYQFFKEQLEQTKSDWILTAHNADDLVETLLLKFFANRELNLIAISDLKRQLLRPMLSFGRNEIFDYAKENQIEFRHDASNDQLIFLRNRVRHTLLPQLEECFGGDIRSIILEQAEKFSRDAVCWEDLLTHYPSEWTDTTFHQIAEMTSAEDALAWRLVEKIFLNQVGYKIGYRAAQRVLQVIRKNIVATEIPGGYRFSRSKGSFSLLRNQ